jgi:uncharacterized membrane protein YagU involved in acid resistance
MSENNELNLSGEKTPSLFYTVVLGGLVAGVLDAADGVVAFGLVKGLNPIQVLQYIASGALGKAAFEGGLATAFLGMLFHFFIAFVVAGIYYGASLIIPILYRQAVLFGLLYGAAVYFVMNYLVLPFSNVSPSEFSLALLLNGIIGHAVFVGLPIALFARYSSEKDK